MPWDQTSFAAGQTLPAAKLTLIQSNFSAMAAGNSGAPPINVNSLVATGVASLAVLRVPLGYTLVGSYTLGEFSTHVLGTEKVIVTASLDTTGGRVNLNGITNGNPGVDAKTVIYRLRVGSLGGTLLNIVQGPIAPGDLNTVVLEASHVPNSGPASYVLTGMNNTDAASIGIRNYTLRAMELPHL